MNRCLKMAEVKVLLEMMKRTPSLRPHDYNAAVTDSVRVDGYRVDPDNLVKIDAFGNFIDGRARVLAARECGITWIPVEVVS